MLRHLHRKKERKLSLFLSKLKDITQTDTPTQKCVFNGQKVSNISGKKDKQGDNAKDQKR